MEKMVLQMDFLTFGLVVSAGSGALIHAETYEGSDDMCREVAADLVTVFGDDMFAE